MDGAAGKAGELGTIVDLLFPDLDAYEAALYVYLYRRTHFVGEPAVRIGKRTIAWSFVRASRGGGKQNQGGQRVNYQHLTEALKALERAGCIRVGDTTRDGTLYTVTAPSNVPSVRLRISSIHAGTVVDPDYFTDPAGRREVFERDGWVCRYCGERLSPDTATLDHFIPQSKGGTNARENLRAACLMCNSIKSGRTYEEVAPLLLESVAGRRGGSAER